MSITDKVKVLMFLWRNKQVLEKLNGLLGKFDGLKSVLGLLMILSYYIAPHFGVNVPEAVLNAGYGFLGVGLVHKLDKATDLIKKGLPILAAVIALLDKKKQEEVKK